MRTTLDLPEDLMTEAMKITKASTKTELIKRALKNIIQQNKISDLKKFKGVFDIGIDLDILRGRDASIG